MDWSFGRLRAYGQALCGNPQAGRPSKSDLVVHVFNRMGGALFFFMPFKSNWHDEWFIYRQMTQAETDNGEFGNRTLTINNPALAETKSTY